MAQRIEQQAGGKHRAFVDSAPVLERGMPSKLAKLDRQKQYAD